MERERRGPFMIDSQGSKTDASVKAEGSGGVS